MNNNNVIDLASREGNRDPLTELLRIGAQRAGSGSGAGELLAAQHVERRTEAGHTGVVRNSYLPDANGRGFGDGSDPQIPSQNR